MNYRDVFASWTLQDDLFFSDPLTQYMYSLNVYTFGDLIDRMEEITDRMESDDRADLVPEFTKHLKRFEDLLDYAKNINGKYSKVPPELIRGLPLVDLNLSSELLSTLAEHHIYTVGGITDSSEEWKTLIESFTNDQLREEFVECVRRITGANFFEDRKN